MTLDARDNSAPHLEVSFETAIIAGMQATLFLFLWRHLYKSGPRRRALEEAEALVDQLFSSNGALAKHTGVLSDELFSAQAELQGAIAMEVDPHLGLDPVWNDLLCENGPLGGRLAAIESPPKGIGPDAEPPSEGWPE
jgi:hypothetical protein